MEHLCETNIASLVTDETNNLDTMVAVSQNGEPQTNTLDYSSLYSSLANHGVDYPNVSSGSSGNSGGVVFGRDFVPSITVDGNVGVPADPAAPPTDPNSLRFEVLIPGAGTYREAISFFSSRARKLYW